MRYLDSTERLLPDLRTTSLSVIYGQLLCSYGQLVLVFVRGAMALCLPPENTPVYILQETDAFKMRKAATLVDHSKPIRAQVVVVVVHLVSFIRFGTKIYLFPI